jgi:hypothetical protein
MNQQIPSVALASMTDGRANDIDAIFMMASEDRTPVAPRNSITISTDYDGLSNSLSPDHTLIQIPTFTDSTLGLPSSLESSLQPDKSYLQPRAWSDAITITCYDSSGGLQPKADINTPPSLSVPYPQHNIYSMNTASSKCHYTVIESRHHLPIASLIDTTVVLQNSKVSAI